MEQNPYESPREQPREKPSPGTVDVAKIKRQNKTAVIVILAILIVPACMIAFFVVCAASAGRGAGPLSSPTNWGLFLSFAASAVVAGAFICAIVATWKWYQGG